MDIKEMQEAPKPGHDILVDMVSNVNARYVKGMATEDELNYAMAWQSFLLKNVEQTKQYIASISASASVHMQAETKVMLARLHVYENDVQAAIVLYEQALQLDPSHEVVLEEIGHCFEHLGRLEEAAVAFKAAITEMEDEPIHKHNYGNCMVKLKKYTEAIDCFKKVIELQPDTTNHYELYYSIAWCYQEMGDFYMAVANYMYSLQNKPDFLEGLNNLGALYYNHEADIPAALPYFLKALSLAEKGNNRDMLVMLYMNLSKLYGRICEYAAHDYYLAKMKELLGFPTTDEDRDEEDSF